MRYRKSLLMAVIIVWGFASISFAEDYSLQYFMAKVSAKANELSKKEKIELLSQLEEVMGQALRIHSKLFQAIQTGEMDIRYQEGRFWVSKLEQDRESIELGLKQLKGLREKPAQLTSSVILFKSLKDLSLNFNAYNNMPSFSALVGDLAPELELWADPVFYRLYLLPLARIKDKDIEAGPTQKEKKPASKVKKP